MITTLYNKPTDTHLYLHYTSAHPSSVMNKSPYGQFLRLRRICALDKDFEINANKLVNYYTQRGYPRAKIIKHFDRAKQKKQEDLLQPLEKDNLDTPVMVTTYNPANPDIKGFIHNNWNIIENTEDLQPIFPNKPLIGFRRLPNLRSQLTSNTIKYPAEPEKANKQELPPVCTRLGKCTYCPLINKITEFTSTHTGNKFKTKDLPPPHRLTCEIYNIVYIIKCRRCQK